MQFKSQLVILCTVILSMAANCQSHNPYDTNYVASYNDRFVVGLFQSYRQFIFDIIEHQPATGTYLDSVATNGFYHAPGRHATGFSLSYDKISLSLAFATPATETETKKYGTTDYFNLGFAITSRQYRVECAYRTYMGFYDKNTSLRVVPFTTDSSYYQRHSMSTLLVKVKGFYFLNRKKRFSYGAAYVNNYRQLKTAASFFLIGDVSYNRLYDPDYFIDTLLAPAWGNFSKLNYISAYGVTLGCGYTFNLVIFRSFYINGLAAGAFGLQRRYAGSSDGLVDQKDLRFALSAADLRAAIGYNGRNFFISSSIGFDVSGNKWKDFSVNYSLMNTYFSFGYRFKVKERGWNRWLRNNRVYKRL